MFEKMLRNSFKVIDNAKGLSHSLLVVSFTNLQFNFLDSHAFGG